MGLISTAASVVNVASNVSRGVFSLAGSGLKAISSITKSKIGKLAIGAGAAAILLSNPNNEGDSMLSKIGDKFKSFFSSMKDSAVGKMATGALTAVTGALGFGNAANNVKENVTELASSGTTLEGAVAEGSAAAYGSGDTGTQNDNGYQADNESEQIDAPSFG